MTALELVNELWNEHTEPCCPYLRHNEDGCYCTSPTLPVGADRSMPCDHFSLQLFCLTEADYTRCIVYPAGDVP
jgi:hypothetical protein